MGALIIDSDFTPTISHGILTPPNSRVGQKKNTRGPTIYRTPSKLAPQTSSTKLPDSTTWAQEAGEHLYSWKVCGPYVVVSLNWTPTFEWYLVNFVVKDGHQSYMCCIEIGLKCSKYISHIVIRFHS